MTNASIGGGGGNGLLTRGQFVLRIESIGGGGGGSIDVLSFLPAKEREGKCEFKSILWTDVSNCCNVK